MTKKSFLNLETSGPLESVPNSSPVGFPKSPQSTFLSSQTPRNSPSWTEQTMPFCLD
jgi:hypothetical protein